MCFIVDSETKFKPGFKGTRKRYKVLVRYKGRLMSPFFPVPYFLGKSKMLPKNKCDYFFYETAFHGLYVFKTLKGAKDEALFLVDLIEEIPVIVECEVHSDDFIARDIKRIWETYKKILPVKIIKEYNP